MSNNFLNQGLSNKIRRSTQQGRKIPALVVETFFEKATVRLATTGALLRNLDIVGGPVVADQIVSVDYSSDIPVVVATGVEGLNEDDVRSLLDELLENKIEATFNISITLFSGGNIRESYSPDVLGLNTALAEANAGDVIYLPDVDITLDFTMPEDVSIVGISSRQSILRGQITTADGASLENCLVVKGEYASDAVYAIVAHSTGRATIKNCEIHAYNCYGGPAYAVKLQTNTDLLELKKCTVIAQSANNGTSYAFLGATGGKCKIIDCFVYGESGQYSGNGLEVSGNTFGDSSTPELAMGCISVDESTVSRAMWTNSNAQDHVPDIFKPWNGDIDTPLNTTIFTDTVNGNKPAGPILRSGKYLYYGDITGGSSVWITEYDMDTDTPNSVLALNQAQSYPLKMALVGDRKVVFFRGVDRGFSDDWIEIYEVDFAAQTTTMVFEFDTEDFAELYDSTGISDGAKFSVTAHKNKNGEIVAALFGQYVHWCDRAKCEGWYVFMKNYTLDTGWTVEFGLHDPTVTTDYDTIFHSFYSTPQVVRNEKLVYAIGTDEPLYGLERGTKILYWVTVDLMDLSVEMTTYSMAWTNTYDAAHPVYAATNNDDGVCFYFIEYWPDTWSYAGCVMFDPYTKEVTYDYYENAHDFDEYLFTSKTKAYWFDYSNQNFYLVERSGVTLLWNQAMASTYKTKVIDDDNRLWWWNPATNVMNGILVTDKNDVLTWTAPVCPNSGVWDNYYLLGNAIWVFWYADGTNDNVLVLTVETP